MPTEPFTLQGKHVRLEPLDSRPRRRLGCGASASDRGLYQWSPVPQGEAEAKKYVDTALAWRDAGTAVPFAIVRADTTASSSVRRASGISNAGHGRRDIRRMAEASRRLRDRLHLVCSIGDSDRRQHRSQAADADPCLRRSGRSCASAFTPTRATRVPAPLSNASADSAKVFSAPTAWLPTSSRAIRSATRSSLRSGRP